MFFDLKTNNQYIESKIDYPVIQDLNSNEGNLNAFIGVYVQMDDTQKVTIRTVNTFLKAFSDSGGLMSIIYIFMTLIVSQL